jgi:hypothetical protein
MRAGYGWAVSPDGRLTVSRVDSKGAAKPARRDRTLLLKGSLMDSRPISFKQQVQ